ncbi:hypothetical protein [Nocardioides sp. WS12]|uniref:hypothetical protein n=1 Tax=Nocardioides sp. WS12 TaxID=2486272 RepID=UPI0015FD8222|nr:hypothetical protein [Nocardioides sp. WS12]
MSSNASALRSRLPHAAPRLAQAALERARLTVVPRRRTTAPRVPFVTFVSIILLAGVIGLLLFNTSMQQASFRATALEKQATDLSAQQEALEMDLQELRGPQRVAQAAQKLGMVIPSTPAGVLHLGSGKISGNPTPASADDSIPLATPGPRKPASLKARTVKVKAGKVNAGTDGAPARNR